MNRLFSFVLLTLVGLLIGERTFAVQSKKNCPKFLKGWEGKTTVRKDYPASSQRRASNSQTQPLQQQEPEFRTDEPYIQSQFDNGDHGFFFDERMP